MILEIRRDKITATYLVFTKLGMSESGKTEVWNVSNKRGTPLGKIKWFSKWRSYCFYPASDTVFNTSCLRDVQTVVMTFNMWKRNRI